MKLKVKDAKAYKGRPEDGNPILEIPLRNGLYAKPGNVFSGENVLGGEATMEGLLEEDPCRVIEVKEPRRAEKKDGKK